MEPNRIIAQDRVTEPEDRHGDRRFALSFTFSSVARFTLIPFVIFQTKPFSIFHEGHEGHEGKPFLPFFVLLVSIVNNRVSVILFLN